MTKMQAIRFVNRLVEDNRKGCVVPNEDMAELIRSEMQYRGYNDATFYPTCGGWRVNFEGTFGLPIKAKEIFRILTSW